MPEPANLQRAIKPRATPAGFGHVNAGAFKLRLYLAVEPGPAVEANFFAAPLNNLERTSGSETLRNQVFGYLAQAARQVVARNHHIAHAGIAATDHDMRVRMTGIVVIYGDPVETPPGIALHLRHELARCRLEVAHARTVFRRDDDPELVRVVFAALQEVRRINAFRVAVIEQTACPVPARAVALEVTDMRAVKPRP